MGPEAVAVARLSGWIGLVSASAGAQGSVLDLIDARATSRGPREGGGYLDPSGLCSLGVRVGQITRAARRTTVTMWAGQPGPAPSKLGSESTAPPATATITSPGRKSARAAALWCSTSVTRIPASTPKKPPNSLVRERT